MTSLHQTCFISHCRQNEYLASNCQCTPCCYTSDEDFSKDIYNRECYDKSKQCQTGDGKYSMWSGCGRNSRRVPPSDALPNKACPAGNRSLAGKSRCHQKYTIYLFQYFFSYFCAVVLSLLLFCFTFVCFLCVVFVCLFVCLFVCVIYS